MTKTVVHTYTHLVVKYSIKPTYKSLNVSEYSSDWLTKSPIQNQ